MNVRKEPRKMKKLIIALWLMLFAGPIMAQTEPALYLAADKEKMTEEMTTRARSGDAAIARLRSRNFSRSEPGLYSEGSS